MDVVQSNEAFKWVDGKFSFQYVQGFIPIQGRLFVAKWKNRQGPPLDLYDQRPVETEDRGPRIELDWTAADQAQSCYVKTPSLLSYADEPNLEELLRLEVETCELLRRHPHPNVARYLGHLETRGRVSGLCFEQCTQTLASAVNPEHLGKADFLQSGRPLVHGGMRDLLQELKGAVDHLHALGIVHNDINPSNIMLREDGTIVLVDFDSCRQLGHDLHTENGPGTKRTHAWHDPNVTAAVKENDTDALRELETWMFGKTAEDFMFSSARKRDTSY
jgi:serine/threonine protein kinase